MKQIELSKKEHDLADKPLKPLIIQLSIPTIIGQLVMLLYNVIDRIYVGRIPETGSLALAGLGVCFPILILIAAFSLLVGIGGAPLAAIEMGKKRKGEAENILNNSFLMLIVFSLILMFFFFIFQDPILRLFGATDLIFYYAKSYLSIYLIGTLSVQLVLGLNVFIICQGFTYISMGTTLIGCILNIILDPIFIYTFNLGIKGAALATIISQSISAIWIIVFLSGKKTNIKLSLKNFKFTPKIDLKILSLGVSIFIMQITECIIQLLFNRSMIQFGNEYYLTIMSIIFSFNQLIFLPNQGLGQGVSAITSYNFGAANYTRVKNTFSILLKWCFLYSFISTALIEIFPRFFLSIFTPSQNIIELGIAPSRIFLAGMSLMGILNAVQQTFIALGQAKSSIKIALFRKLVLLIPLAIILPRIGIGIWGVFVAEAVSDAASSVYSILLYRKESKKILS